jgi:hypothetical protein
MTDCKCSQLRRENLIFNQGLLSFAVAIFLRHCSIQLQMFLEQGVIDVLEPKTTFDIRLETRPRWIMSFIRC